VSGWTITVVTVLLVALSAFFVAAEFALLAAKRHRLQDRAADSRSARAALRSANELTVLLAGCQLGITACALGLGALTKPAVKYTLLPVMEGTGVPEWISTAGAFGLALLFVTFLHLVVGEMAPKSWAIAHPESAATLLALPMRAFMWTTRPLLMALNDLANRCLRRVGVEPSATIASGRTAEDLRQLVEHSASVGTLEQEYSTHLAGALDLREATLGDLLEPGRTTTSVSIGATVREVREATLRSGHLRILIHDDADVVGVVHVRDTLREDPSCPAVDLMRPVFTMEASTPVYTALATMRETRNHLIYLPTPGASGVVTLNDVLGRLFAQPESV
jgi:CBS domain containing-hemolysin-like protein